MAYSPHALAIYWVGCVVWGGAVEMGRIEVELGNLPIMGCIVKGTTEDGVGEGARWQPAATARVDCHCSIQNGRQTTALAASDRSTAFDLVWVIQINM